MKKTFLALIGISSLALAEISVQEAVELEIRAAEIRKELGIHTPTTKEKKLERIRAELNLDFDTSSKEALLETNKPDTVASLVASEEKSISDVLSDEFSSITNKLGFNKTKKKNDTYSFSGTLNSFYDTVGLEEGESWGMPSVFGFNQKKSEPLFGIKLLGDVQDSGKFMYKSMKYSGTSAEFTSGMMYRSSKMYNTMFGMFDDSPFNIFEEEKETSVFDVFEGGNKVLDIFD